MATIGKKIKSLKINYRKWLHGQRGGLSCLLNDKGKMCCLGFECVARGLDSNEIKNKSTPESVVSNMYDVDILSMTHDHADTHSVGMAVEINDDNRINDKTRIKKLKKLFRRRGIKLSFTNLPKRLKAK